MGLQRQVSNHCASPYHPLQTVLQSAVQTLGSVLNHKQLDKTHAEAVQTVRTVLDSTCTVVAGLNSRRFQCKGTGLDWDPPHEMEDLAAFGQKLVGTLGDTVKGALDKLQDSLKVDQHIAGTERVKHRSACLLRIVVDQDATSAKAWNVGSLATLRPCQTCRKRPETVLAPVGSLRSVVVRAG